MLFDRNMEPLVQVTFRNMSHSDAIDAYVRARAGKLDTFSARVTGCRVVVEAPHKHAGRHFKVLVDVTVPGNEVVVSHMPDETQANEDAYAAIDHAFDQLGRRLEDHVRKQRGDVKHHESAYRAGRVVKLWAYEGYGFIESPDGYEVYFHKNSVRDHAFDKLAIGSQVRFLEEEGDKGPQASTVALAG